MSYEFRRGAAALEEAATRKSGGQFNFVPRLRWRDDGEQKFVLVLTPIEDVVTVLLHEWIPVAKFERSDGEEGTRWDDFISRKDPAIAEDYDELQERLERDPKLRAIGVAVELEPVYEDVKGRKKVTSFTVATSEYTRKTDDGEEEVTQPNVNLIIESAITLWGGIGSLDQSRGPISDLPIEITRRGKDQNTRYDIFPLEAPVDLAPIVEYLEGISYLADEIESIEQSIGKADSELEAAQIVAKALLSKRLIELADGNRYEELVTPLKLEDMPKKFGAKKSKKEAKRERPARQTRRETAQAEPAEENGSDQSQRDRFDELKARFQGGEK